MPHTTNGDDVLAIVDDVREGVDDVREGVDGGEVRCLEAVRRTWLQVGVDGMESIHSRLVTNTPSSHA